MPNRELEAMLLNLRITKSISCTSLPSRISVTYYRFTKIILPEKYVSQVVLMLQNQGHIYSRKFECLI